MSDVGSPSLRVLSIASGGGGLDRAVELAIPGARTVVYVEREAFACAVLVAQMQAGVLADCPVWTDARSFPGRRFRGAVDLVIAGYPCQPFSLAGQRRGASDPRHLWPIVRRRIVQCGAWAVFLENVGGHLSLGADRVLADLGRLGFACEIGLFRASDVGLPHERERLFILGVADARGERRQQVAGRPHGDEGADEGRAALDHHEPQRGEQGLADAKHGRRQGREQAWSGSGAVVPRDCFVEHTPSVGWREGRPEPAVRRGRDAAARDGGAVVHTLSGGRDGRPEGPLGEPQRRTAEQQPRAGGDERPFLRPPGPADLDAWRLVAEQSPRLLPAVSRHDLFQIEIGAARAAAHGDPQARPSEAWGDQAPASWLDPAGPYGLRAPVVQAIAQRTLRGMADGLASRIDQLRLLGNGVVDAQGALAFRTLATELSRRSAGAALLVRMMDDV